MSPRIEKVYMPQQGMEELKAVVEKYRSEGAEMGAEKTDTRDLKDLADAMWGEQTLEVNGLVAAFADITPNSENAESVYTGVLRLMQDSFPNNSARLENPNPQFVQAAKDALVTILTLPAQRPEDIILGRGPRSYVLYPRSGTMATKQILPSQARTIVERYGLDGEGPKSVKALTEKYSISESEVRDQIARARKKISQNPRMKSLVTTA